MNQSKKQSPAVSSSIGFFGLLAIVFITLKLCGVITWDWWIVLSPLWGQWCCLLPLAIVVLAIMAAFNSPR